MKQAKKNSLHTRYRTSIFYIGKSLLFGLLVCKINTNHIRYYWNSKKNMNSHKETLLDK